MITSHCQSRGWFRWASPPASGTFFPPPRGRLGAATNLNNPPPPHCSWFHPRLRAEGIIQPRRLFNKSSICPQWPVSMETEAFIVLFPALSRSVCFLNNPVTLLASFLYSVILFTLSAQRKSLKTHILASFTQTRRSDGDYYPPFVSYSSSIFSQNHRLYSAKII